MGLSYGCICLETWMQVGMKLKFLAKSSFALKEMLGKVSSAPWAGKELSGTNPCNPRGSTGRTALSHLSCRSTCGKQEGGGKCWWTGSVIVNGVNGRSLPSQQIRPVIWNPAFSREISSRCRLPAPNELHKAPADPSVKQLFHYLA